jgi:hypothetical protein
MNENELIETLRSAKEPLDLALFLLECSSNGNSKSGHKILAEAPSVTLKILLLQELQKAINDKRLIPVKTLDIAPGTLRNLFVVLTPDGEDKPFIQVRIIRII